MSAGGRLDIDTEYELMGYGPDEVDTLTICTGTIASSQQQSAVYICHMIERDSESERKRASERESVCERDIVNCLVSCPCACTFA